MVEKKLKLLERILTEQSELLDKLLEISNKQKHALESSDIAEEEFDAYVDEQERLIEQLECLNVKTDTIYHELERESTSGIAKYEGMTKSIQILIVQLNDKVTSLREIEETSKDKLEQYLQIKRKNLGEGRRTSKAALDYYRSMSKSNVIPPQFMDKKK